MESNKKKEKSEKVTKRAERRRLRSEPERTSTTRQKNSVIEDGDRAVK